jgi:magnesium chelatase family protein
MALARTLSVALTGIRGHLIEVEADLSAGLPGLTFTGLPDVAVNEARDRVRAAVLNSGFGWPNQRITVALLPADVRKSGSAFDLALALSVLAADGKVSAEQVREVVWLAELGLDGRLRSVRGILPCVLAARNAGARAVVVANGNAFEAALVSDVEIYCATSLAEILAAFRGEGPPLSRASAGEQCEESSAEDLADVVGQPIARRAVEVAAAGAHHLLFSGVPGAGKTMLAARLPGILPPLDDAAALEVTAIHSIAGLLPPTGLIRRPPLQAPHHSASMAALVGGGSGMARPGAATLAHRGVLVLDEAAEFAPKALDALRQPLESGRIVLHRSRGVVEYPARFQLVLATNPCPCGASKDRDCRCTPDARRRYGQRLSGPLTDRIDLRVPIDPVSRADLMDDVTARESSAVVAARVLQAREAARQRWAPHGFSTNAEVPGALLRRRPWRPARSALVALDRELDAGGLSARGCDRVLKLAWTLSDLAGTDSPSAMQILEAIGFRTGRAGSVAA